MKGLGMKQVKIDKNQDVIDFVADNPELCKGRKIFIDREMVEKVKELTENVKEDAKKIQLNIICPETGNATIVDIEKAENLFLVKEIKADDIEPIGAYNHKKEPIFVGYELKKTLISEKGLERE